PCLPDVAFKLRSAIQKDIGVQEAVKIINFDSVIASRLIQIVNSPLYRAVNPITSCHDAVARLGLATTRNLVTSISIQNLFKSKNKEIKAKIHQLWKQSVQVSSISYTLASLTKKVNPDEALLAGLTHNIGVLPILIFADGLKSDEYTAQDLELTISTLQGLVGSLVLEKWGFPEKLKETPKNVERWYGHEQGEIEISDIVLLAKFHSYIGTKQMQKLPPIHTLPAFQKLGDNELTPDMSLQTLYDARQQISEAMSLFMM
ncbi:MAG: HDOD domain-containing protein, partial [Methylomarinum sp.]|nr:HDOD domain-containing protein [Methylomarinum sp.]